MSLVLSGTDGLSDIDGSAATPAIRGTDANTGIFFPAADTIAFAEGGAEAMRINSSGFVGIGTTTPTRALHVVGTWTNTGDYLMDSGSPQFAWSSGDLRFKYGGLAGTEAARIDARGRLLVNTTSAGYGSIGSNTLTVVSGSSSGAALFYTNYAGDAGTAALKVGKYDSSSATSQIFIQFARNNSTNGCGQINGDGAGGAAFGSFSDRRLKENIESLPPQLDNILALRPVEFDFVESEGAGHQIGFIAQEIQAIYPDVVGVREPDGMLTVTGWSKTDARLVKAIQEQQALIVSLQDTITALTTRITALEAA